MTVASKPAGAVDARPWSLWAIASLAISPLPLLSILAPVVGLAGLSQTRYRGYRGQGLAFAGIAIGALVTLATVGVIFGVAMRTRPLVLEGPRGALNAAVSGDLDGLRGALWGPAAEAAEADPAAFERFVAEVQARYGSVNASQQSEDQAFDDGLPVESGQFRIRYEMRFERGGAAPVETVLVIHEPDRVLPWVLRWAAIEIHDPVRGTLAFPPPAVSADPSIPPVPVPDA